MTRRRGSSSVLTPLGEILRRSADRLGLNPAARLLAARQAWGEVVPGQVAEASRVVGLRGGTLSVATGHPAVAQEIRLRQESILVAMRARMAEPPERLQVLVGHEGKMAKKPSESGF